MLLTTSSSSSNTYFVYQQNHVLSPVILDSLLTNMDTIRKWIMLYIFFALHTLQSSFPKEDWLGFQHRNCTNQSALKPVAFYKVTGKKVTIDKGLDLEEKIFWFERDVRNLSSKHLVSDLFCVCVCVCVCVSWFCFFP